MSTCVLKLNFWALVGLTVFLLFCEYYCENAKVLSGSVLKMLRPEPAHQNPADQIPADTSDSETPISKLIDSSKNISEYYDRLLNGVDADIKDYPYQALMFWSKGPGSDFGYCGGSIISPKYVLTAAHCFFDHGSPKKMVPYDIIDVRVGSSDFNTGLSQHIAEYNLHPNYDGSTYDYDVALMRVSTPFKFDETVKSVSLISKDIAIADDSLADLTGWGLTNSWTKHPATLKKINMVIIPQQECFQRNAHPECTTIPVTPRIICAMDPGNEKLRPCSGDSGGPLVIDGIQVGIVSWGLLICKVTECPYAFTRITAVRDWVNKVTGL